MKIVVSKVTDAPEYRRYAESTEELNGIYSGTDVREFHFAPSLDVEVLYYRSGREIFFQGHLGGMVDGCCSRCLRRFSFPIEKEFDFVLTPEPPSTKSGELNRDEMGLSYYSGEEIDLSPYVHEQVLLALPTRPLCDERCRGLCPSCGINMNVETCLCVSSSGDPRMAFFRNLRVGR